ncbi:MAG: methyltransferase family protein [Candidatus Acidiferrales bacterium]
MSEKRRFWMQWRVRLGYPVAVAYWLLASPTRRSIMYGAIVAALGLIVRGVAAGYLRKYQELATSGPYARTRNPLYLGSGLLAAGFIVAGHSWIAGPLVAVYFAVFYYFVMRNEEEDLRSRFGATFGEYARRVPLFFPRMRPASGWRSADAGQTAKTFSWGQYRRNHEYQASMGTVLGFVAVWIRIWLPVWESFRHR